MLPQTGARRHRIVLLLLTCSFAAVCLPGCGGGGEAAPQTVPVSGTVYLDSQPLEGASVNFVSTSGKFAAFGRTGPDGHYELAQGAVVGANKIHITKLIGDGLKMNPEEGMDEGQLEAMAIAKISEARSISEALSWLGREERAAVIGDPHLLERLARLPAA